MAWHKGKIQSLNNSQEICTWRQVLQKENALMKHKAVKELAAHEAELYRKNNYMHLFKSEGVVKQETIAEKTGKSIIFVYDQAMRDKESTDGYCQKCKRESVWCKDRKCRDLPKNNLSATLTTSQVYGWRPPIDNLQTGFSREAVCKRTFHDHGHL